MDHFSEGMIDGRNFVEGNFFGIGHGDV
jgi:hypothetical protein